MCSRQRSSAAAPSRCEPRPRKRHDHVCLRLFQGARGAAPRSFRPPSASRIGTLRTGGAARSDDAPRPIARARFCVRSRCTNSSRLALPNTSCSSSTRQLACFSVECSRRESGALLRQPIGWGPSPSSCCGTSRSPLLPGLSQWTRDAKLPSGGRLPRVKWRCRLC